MNNKNTNLSIIIPTFNEKENIILLVKKLKEVLINRNYEVIIVDDNSSDGTYKKIVKEYGRDKKIVSILRKNERGLGSAILLGIKKSKYETIIGMDADFNHPPELISKMLKKIYECDLVIASRFIKGGGMKDKKRYFFTFLFNWFLKNLLGFPTMDNMSGFYAVKKEKLLELPLREIYKGYGEYHLRLVYLAGKNSLSIKEIPVFYKNRLYGKSKSNLLKMFITYTYFAFKLSLYER